MGIEGMGVSGLQACCGGRWGLSMLVVRGTPPCWCTCGLSLSLLFGPKPSARCHVARGAPAVTVNANSIPASHERNGQKPPAFSRSTGPGLPSSSRQPPGVSRHTLHLPTKLSSFTDNPLPISHKPPCVCPLAAGIVPAAPCLLPAVPCATVPQRPSPAMPYAHGGEPRRIH